MKRIALVVALALSGCGGNPGVPTNAATVTADSVFAAESTYQLAAASEAALMPSLDAATKAKIKTLDNQAFNALHPLVLAASTPGMTIDAVAFAAAQVAVTAFSNATQVK